MFCYCVLGGKFGGTNFGAEGQRRGRQWEAGNRSGDWGSDRGDSTRDLAGGRVEERGGLCFYLALPIGIQWSLCFKIFTNLEKKSSENVLSYEEKEGQNDILIKSLILVGLERRFHRIEILHFKVKKFAISCV